MDRRRSIAAVQGAGGPVIQGLLQAFAVSLGSQARVVGLIEEHPPPGAAEAAQPQLRSLVDGRAYPIFQDLGPSSVSCGLDAESVVSACEAARRDLAGGCDLLVLSKFGKLEAERSGLAEAFALAVELQVPILTSVSPRYVEPWRAFAAPLFVTLPAEMDAIQRWWAAAAQS